MNRLLLLCILTVCLLSTAFPQSGPPSLRGLVTDPSGATIPGATVHVSGPSGDQEVTADNYGRYAFPSLKAGKYTVRVTAPGFTTGTKSEVDVSGPMELNPQLAILSETQVVNVEDDTNERDHGSQLQRHFGGAQGKGAGGAFRRS